MKKQATFKGWQFGTVWGIIEDVTYPYLLWEYKVPNLVGLTPEEAVIVLNNNNFILGTIEENCSSTIPEGIILGQDPLAGTQSPPGSSVNIIISSGPCPVGVVPYLIGLPLSSAQTEIIAVGLTVGDITYQCNNVVPENSVISQNPSPGIELPLGSPVDLIVSTGPCPVTVPNVVGMLIDDADDALVNVGLYTGTIQEQCSDTIPKDRIISQNPSAGEQIPYGSFVDIIISVGPCPEGEGIVEGNPEGTVEGEGIAEGTIEGTVEGEGVAEGNIEGTIEGEGIAEGNIEGSVEGEGVLEGNLEGTIEGEGIVEGNLEGTVEGEGVTEGNIEGTVEGEGIVEGNPEGTVEGEGVAEGNIEGTIEGEGVAEGNIEGTIEGVPEGLEGEGIIEGNLEGNLEGTPEGISEGEWEILPIHSADQNGDGKISLVELLRVIQFFNSAGFHCADGTEDGYNPGPNGEKTCRPHASDYNPRNWEIGLTELLRLIQFFNSGGYHKCEDSEDGYCPSLI